MDQDTQRPRIRRRRWTGEEDATLRTLYGSLPAWELAERLDRTEDAVWLRVRTLGLGKRPEVEPWTEAELADLQRCYSQEAPAAIAARLGRTPSSVYQQARCMGLLTRKALLGQSAVHGYFDVIDTAEKAYILGLMAADGNVSDRGRIAFGLQAKDAELVRFVHDRLFPGGNLSIASRDGFVYFQRTSHPMVTALARWGIVPRKSRTLEWPALGEMQRPFLLGYFDGDGCGYMARGRPGWSVCSGSEQLLIDMKAYILEATGVVLEKIHHRPKTSLYQVAKTGPGAYILDQWLHQDGLGLARKRFPPWVAVKYGG